MNSYERTLTSLRELKEEDCTMEEALIAIGEELQDGLIDGPTYDEATRAAKDFIIECGGNINDYLF